MGVTEDKDWETLVGRELVRAKRAAFRELGKMETDLRITLESLERSVKKNPRQTTIIALSLGAAIGATGMRFLKSKKRHRTRS